MKKVLITSALPYVNNIPHLGNIIGCVLSADVFARYCRLKKYDTLYVCGNDEYGTATETKALEEGVSCEEICSKYHKIHKEIYDWFNISFDCFGRTSTPKHTRIVQDIFLKLYNNGYIKSQEVEQFYCEHCNRFLADRYIHGKCPNCEYERARGDQCENCGKLLNPEELLNPVCKLCSKTPHLRKSEHLFLDLPALLPELKKWIDKASKEGFWSFNTIKATESWIKSGLKPRCITRDLKWGVKVPLEEYKDKVFYVWFDAPIGYISITANYVEDWQSWWKNPSEVYLYQFMGKDNIPFHSVIFPATQLGTKENWTMVYHINTTEYLNYEHGKFSKSAGTGVFGDDAINTGISSDLFRYFLISNRPEKNDTIFSWQEFMDRVNGELIDNYGNLVSRLQGLLKRFDNKVPEASYLPEHKEFINKVIEREKVVEDYYEHSRLKDALRETILLTKEANRFLQETEPWEKFKSDIEHAKATLKMLAHFIKDATIMLAPVIPQAATRVFKKFGKEQFYFDDLGDFESLTSLPYRKTEVLFKKLESDFIESLRVKFSGRKKDVISLFNKLELRAGKIVEVENHPKADKLFVEKVDIGGNIITIVSGLRDYYSENDLLNKNVIIVKNLKPARLRGIESAGMLLAAQNKNDLEVIFLPDNINPGELITIENVSQKENEEKQIITIEEFSEVLLCVKNGYFCVGDKKLVCKGEYIKLKRIENAKVS